MALTSPTISWEAIVSESTTYTGDYNYTCKLSKTNPNDPGYGDLQIGYYVVDFVGHIFEITGITFGGDSEAVIVHDLLEREEENGPYGLRESYVYGSLYQAATVAQAKLNRLDESAEDFVRSLGVDTAFVNAVQFNTAYDDSGETPTEGLVHWNSADNTMDLHTGYGTTLQVGQELHIKVYNNSGSTISDGKAVYPTGAFNDYPTIGLAKTDTHETINVDYGMTTTSMDDGEYGFVTWFGKVRDINTSTWNVGDVLYISDTNAGDLTNVRPTFPSYAMQIGIVFIKDAVDGQIFVTSRDTVKDTFQNFWNGVFRESIDFTVSSNGTVVTGSLVPSDGHPDLTMLFSDGFSILDTSPAKTIVLTPGTDSDPVENFVYVLQSTKALAASTVDWPAAEHIRVASIVLRSAATTVTEDALKNQNWNDHIQDTTTNQGHLSHIAKAIRRKIPASYESGIDLTTTIVTASSPDDVYIRVTSGVVMQLHDQSFPALDMETGDLLHVVNNFATPYSSISNINTQTLDALGVSMSNKSFSTVTWGIANKSGETSHIMFNLPTGSYPKNSPELAVSDAYNHSVYDIPKIFQGVGFLIARHTWVLDAAGTGWTLHETEDLRGKIPNTTAGGGAGGGVGATIYLGLTDTDSTYIGHTLKVPQVNSAETGLEFTSDPQFTSVGIGIAPTDLFNVAGAGDTLFSNIVNMTLDVAHTAALLVEQNGVMDNVLVVDTINGRVGINTVPSSAFEVSGDITSSTFITVGLTDFTGGSIRGILLVTGDYTVTSNDYTIVANAGSNTVTLTLPAVPTNGQVFNIKSIDSTFACTVARNGNNIDDAATDRNLVKNQAETYQFLTGFGWIIL
jgi:hypothetical protein